MKLKYRDNFRWERSDGGMYFIFDGHDYLINEIETNRQQLLISSAYGNRLETFDQRFRVDFFSPKNHWSYTEDYDDFY